MIWKLKWYFCQWFGHRERFEGWGQIAHRRGWAWHRTVWCERCGATRGEITRGLKSKPLDLA